MNSHADSRLIAHQQDDEERYKLPEDNKKPSTEKCVKTTCPYCGTGCGISVQTTSDIESNCSESVVDTTSLQINGDQQHPANFGKLCSKGTHLSETVDLSARLLHPEVDGQSTSWSQALDSAGERLQTIIAQHGSQAVAIYCSGQLLTEDYYVANKLMKGFIGSANIDTNSRLCMSSAVAGHKRAFGSDTVPGCYADLDEAQLVVLTGSNAAWCHPILYKRITNAKHLDPQRRLVVIDPRRTASCDEADLHLPIKPGSDATLFNGLLVYLVDQGHQADTYIQQHTLNFSETLEEARRSAPDIQQVAKTCELSVEEVTRFYQWFATTQQSVTCFSQGINQSSSGTDKVNAIINVHLATGRIGLPGTGPLSLTGQPNAMGGREVGGLANQLAAHMDLDNPRHQDLVSRFWGTEQLATSPGYKAVDLFQAIDRGDIKAVWIMATNPVDSLPDADRVRSALDKCELVMLSECMNATDTSVLADIRFPALPWGERDGTVTNAERRISRQRPLQPPSGEAKADWWIISEMAKRLGHQQAFQYDSPWQIFREHAQLTAFENSNEACLRDLDLSALSDINQQEYDELSPMQWPINEQYPQGRARLFDDGQFYSPDHKARFIAITPRGPYHAPDTEYPLTLNTGRLRDQWHTMTRTGLSATLSAHRPEPFVEIHPDTARENQLMPGELARLRSRWGTMLARVEITETIARQQVFVPIHWSDQFASQGRMAALINPVVDPVSGQPESKQTPVKIAPFLAQWQGFLLTRKPRMTILDNCDYRVAITAENHQRIELAGTHMPTRWSEQARHWLEDDAFGEWIEYTDTHEGCYRAAHLVDGQLQSVLYINKNSQLPEREWLAGLFNKPQLSEEERKFLLSGRSPSGIASAGPIVCACLSVRRNTITEAINKGEVDSIESVACTLKAGSNCGSCVPEIRELLTASGR